METNRNRFLTMLFTLSLIGLTQSNAASAASACKGLESAACDASSSCSWVEGYTRKDGRAVKSFCRAKASSKKSADASSAQQQRGKKAAQQSG